MTNETTAGQPKSIGDDAQFWAELSLVRLSKGAHEQIKRAEDFLVPYIDNFRAPAAQASATIQAAPVASSISYWTGPTDSAGTPIDRPDNTSPNGWGEYVPTTLKHGRAIVERGDKDKRVKFLYDATIQEPVMAAEPVGVLKRAESIDTPEFRALLNAYHCAEQDGLEAAYDAAVKYVDSQAAAPMVADPAGVAGFAELRTGLKKLNRTTDCEHLIHQLDALAATVKAVPSEALPVEPSEMQVLAAAIELSNRCADECCVDRRDYWKQYGDSVKVEARAFLVAAFAAPLAEKTGGGE